MRRFRLNYFLYNFFVVRSDLKPALAKLSKIGVRNALWKITHDRLPENQPPFSQHPHEELPRHLSNHTLQAYPTMRQQFVEGGYATWPQLISEDEANAICSEVNQLIDQGALSFNYTGTKIMDAWQQVSSIRELAKSERITTVLSSLVGAPVEPFQTIYFEKGSEQAAHSDYFHMTTYPDFGLIAIWIALEPIHSENGPVFYYPGSHQWPPVFNKDLPLKENQLFLDANPNRCYETHLNRVIEKSGIEPETFVANTGDALIWHANLVHGGSKQIDPLATRRSLVIHYFASEAICYHEISQRLAVIKPF